MTYHVDGMGQLDRTTTSAASSQRSGGLFAWIRRRLEVARTEQALSSLDDRLLSDIGLTPNDVRRGSRNIF